MIRLLDVAKAFILKADIPQEGLLADFTMGNGNDTLFLLSLVPKGKVYAFDIQKDSIVNTEDKIKENGFENAVLICDSHENLDKYIKEPINAGIFNLGYRPGGDKNIYTKKESTLIAVQKAMEILAPGGIIAISVYPGHEEGNKEGEMLLNELSLCDKKEYNVISYKIINAPDSPFIIAIQKNKNKMQTKKNDI